LAHLSEYSSGSFGTQHLKLTYGLTARRQRATGMGKGQGDERGSWTVAAPMKRNGDTQEAEGKSLRGLRTSARGMKMPWGTRMDRDGPGESRRQVKVDGRHRRGGERQKGEQREEGAASVSGSALLKDIQQVVPLRMARLACRAITSYLGPVFTSDSNAE